MSELLIQSETITDIADAIRAKTGGTSSMTPLEMPTEIASIPSGGGGLSLVDTATLNAQFSGKYTELYTACFGGSTLPQNCLFVVIPSNDTTSGTYKFLYGTGATIKGTAVVGSMNRNGTVYAGSYTINVSNGATLSLYAIDYGSLL